MRRISEMYKRSGGTNYEHVCGECNHFKCVKLNKVRQSICDIHGDEKVEWKKTYIACKFYNIKHLKSCDAHASSTEWQQISISDFMTS